MNVELAAQMFKNYRSNVLFHLEGKNETIQTCGSWYTEMLIDAFLDFSDRLPARAFMRKYGQGCYCHRLQSNILLQHFELEDSVHFHYLKQRSVQLGPFPQYQK